VIPHSAQPLSLPQAALFKMMYGTHFDKCTKMSHEFAGQTESASLVLLLLLLLAALFSVDFFMYWLLLLLLALSIKQTQTGAEDGAAAYTCFCEKGEWVCSLAP